MSLSDTRLRYDAPWKRPDRDYVHAARVSASAKAVTWCETPLHHSMGERMIQQEPGEQDKPANHPRISRLLPDRRAAATAAALLVVGLAIGYIAGV